MEGELLTAGVGNYGCWATEGKLWVCAEAGPGAGRKEDDWCSGRW